MVTLARAERLSLPLAPAVAIVGAVLIALTLLIMPAAVLERLVTASGIAAVVAAAEPPLGLTARVALGLILGGGFAGFAWFGLSLIGDTALDLGKAGELLRRSDIHPDAPPRPPLFAARDLGTPFLEVKAGTPPRDPLDMTPDEQPLPADLDQPMGAFDPYALLADPLPAHEPVAPLAESASVVEAAPEPTPRPALIDPGDRIETFELTPVGRAAPLPLRAPPVDDWFPLPVLEPAAVASAPEPVPAPKPEAVVTPETEATVHDLLARLERGISGRAPDARPAAVQPIAPVPAGTGSLAGTLGDLRRLATGTC